MKSVVHVSSLKSLAVSQTTNNLRIINEKDTQVILRELQHNMFLIYTYSFHEFKLRTSPTFYLCDSL